MVTDTIPEWSAAARQDGEPKQHYAWFVRYLNLGEGRTLARVAEDEHRHATTVRKVAARNRWRQRVREREWEQDQQEADHLRQGAASVAGQALDGAMAQTRQLSRVASEARPNPDEVKLRDVSAGLRDMMSLASTADSMAQAKASEPKPVDPGTHGGHQDAARTALLSLLSSPESGQRMQAARALLGVAEEQGADLDNMVSLLTGAVGTVVGAEESRQVAARIAQPEAGSHEE